MRSDRSHGVVPQIGVVLSVALVAALAGCSSGGHGAARVERRDSAGVEIVRSPGPDVILDWRFEPGLRLGGAAEGPQSFYHLWPGAVVTDRAGRIYVLDPDAAHVVAFDSTGRYLRTFGTKGGGPGELEQPTAIAVGPGGSVTVADAGKGAFVRYDPDAHPLPQIAFGDRRYFGGPIAATTRGLAFPVHERSDPSSPDVEPMRLAVYGAADTLTVVSFRRPRPKSLRFESCSGLLSIAMPPLFTPDLVWAAREDTIAAVAGTAYAVDLFAGGRRFASLRRAVEPREVTDEMARREVAEGMTISGGGVRCTLDPAEVVAKRGHAPVLPTIEGLALAPDGRIWVRRGAVKGEDPNIDVLDRDGSYMGTLPPGSPFPAAFLPDGRLVTTETDEMDVNRIVVYRFDSTR